MLWIGHSKDWQRICWWLGKWQLQFANNKIAIHKLQKKKTGYNFWQKNESFGTSYQWWSSHKGEIASSIQGEKNKKYKSENQWSRIFLLSLLTKHTQK
jgi:hypothetical protein